MELNLMANNGRRLTAEQKAEILKLRADKMPLLKIAQTLDCALFTVQYHVKQDRERREALATNGGAR